MDLSIQALDLRFVQTGEAMGISKKALLTVIRTRKLAGQIPDYWRRRNQALKIRQSSPYGNLIPREKGYHLFGPDFIPGTAAAVAEAAALVKSKEGAMTGAKKPFFANIMTRDDLERCTNITELAYQPMMFEAAAGYLGSYPTLRSVGVYVSDKNSSEISSQKFHWDANDLHQLKCFINVNDVGPKNGPFTFFPADVADRTGLTWQEWHDDDVVFNKIDKKHLVELIGPPGTGAFVDTSTCLHFGSRCREDRRIVIMLNYIRNPDMNLKLSRYKKKGTALLVGDDHDYGT